MGRQSAMVSTIAIARFAVLAVLGLLAAQTGADDSPRTKIPSSDPQIQSIAQFATTEIRKLCAHCHWHMKVSYENFEIRNVLSAAKGSPAFGNGTNYYMRLDLETKGPGYYQGEHDVYIFTGDKDEYKSLALDEFPQMEKPFLGDRILMEKAWVREGKTTLLEQQQKVQPWVGFGPGHVLTAAKHAASHSEVKPRDEL